MAIIRTNFESGNIGDWQAGERRLLRFKAPLDGAPLAMWFYFRLEGAGAGPFDFILDNLFECLESTHWGDVRPVMRPLDGEWQRVKDEDVQVDLARGEFRFRFDLPDQPVEIAYSYPYPPSRIESLLDELAQSPGVETSHPGMSAEGRPLPYVVMRCLGNTQLPEILWFHSREHAGEVSGGFALEGLLRSLVSSPLRQSFEIHAMPVIDIDAVASGRYGKLAPPVDHHMCWTPDTPRPEVKLAMQLMRESVSAGNKFRLLVNFHSPSPENDSYVVPYNPTLLPASLRSEAEQLAGCVQRRFPKDFPLTADETSYQRVAPWWHDDIEQRPEGFVLNAFGAGSMALEIAYHASSTGTPTSPKKLLEIGACAARGLEDFLTGGSKVSIPLYGSLAPIFNQTDGWILWQIPWHTRISFQKTHAWAVGDDPQARVYFGGPDRYLPEHIPLRFSRRPGGEAVVKWLCYDEDGNRLLAASPLQELPVTKSPEQLQISCELPPLTARVRPGFLLNGSFRPFEIWA